MLNQMLNYQKRLYKQNFGLLMCYCYIKLLNLHCTVDCVAIFAAKIHLGNGYKL